MPHRFNQLEFVVRRFIAARNTFLLNGGRDLLRLRANGGGDENAISDALRDELERALGEAGALADATVDREYFYDGEIGKALCGMDRHGELLSRISRNLRPGGEVGIRPGIIVHRRGPAGPNYLVFEVKKRSNRNRYQTKFDRLKLEELASMRQKYHYRFGLQVRAVDSRVEVERDLELVSVWCDGIEVPAAKVVAIWAANSASS